MHSIADLNTHSQTYISYSLNGGALVNNAPTVANPIPDKLATSGTAFTFTFASNTFNDVDGDILTYTATLSNGNPLPSWLTFSPSIRTFNGTPASGDVGVITAKVTASDGNLSVSDQFTITTSLSAVNHAPTVANPIPNQTATVGSAYAFTFASNAFNDPDGDTLTYTATLSNGSALPGWLSFNPSTRAFSGTPTSGYTGVITVKVTASDGSLTVSDEFTITTSSEVVNNAPTVANPIPDQTATTGSAYTFTFASNTFNDVDGDILTYTATLSDGNALPSWLSFNPSTRTLNGTPASANVGVITTKVTASDGNLSVSDQFTITTSLAATADPYFDNVNLLIPGGEANASTTIVDRAKYAFTMTNNGATYSNAQTKFESTSLYFNGSARITKSADAAFEMPTDFTWEFWIYPNSSMPAFCGIITFGMWGRMLIANNGGLFWESSTGVYGNKIAGETMGAGSFTPNAWQHIAVTRSGNTWRTFKDGALLATSTASGTPGTTNSLEIGSFNGPDNFFNGYLEGIRFTNGICRYTAAFTAPTAAFPRS